MSCRNCVDCGCKKCTSRYGKAASSAEALAGSSLRDGVYDNATVTVRGGKVTSVQRGKSTFHSFTDPCALNTIPDGEDPAGAEASGAGFFLQNSTCVLVEGRGTSASPASLKLNLNPDQFHCSQAGLTLKPPLIAGASQNLCEFEVLDGRVIKLPSAIVTHAESSTPETLSVSLVGCKLTVGLAVGSSVAGNTLYTTYAKGSCKGPYPIWVVKAGSTYTVNIGYAVSGAAATDFADLATAVAAADSFAAQVVADCDRDTGGAAGPDGGV